jgi:starch phosphorylase
MKFSLNGALTIGTLDGANIEILEEVGRENIFIFGLTAEKVAWERKNPSRTPFDIYRENPEVRHAIDSIRDGAFSDGSRELFRPIVDSLLDQHDPYLMLMDLEDYLRCQDVVAREYEDVKLWTRKAIINVANMGKFSTDRTIREYANDIWGIKA